MASPSPPPGAAPARTTPSPGSSSTGPSALRVEDAGLDVIAESERKGRPRDLFMPWFAANISVLGLSWGSWVLGFGLSFAQAVAASVIGVVVSFLLCGVIAVLGKRGSAPTLALSRAAFGYHGNRLSAAISWMLTVGWETVLCVLATLASATVLQALGWHNEVGAQVVGFVVTVSLAAGAGILGFDAIMRVQTWITWATGILTVVYLVLVWPTVDWAAVKADGDFQCVFLGGAFLNRRSGDTTSDSTKDGANDLAASAANIATGNAANGSAREAAYT